MEVLLERGICQPPVEGSTFAVYFQSRSPGPALVRDGSVSTGQPFLMQPLNGIIMNRNCMEPLSGSQCISPSIWWVLIWLLQVHPGPTALSSCCFLSTECIITLALCVSARALTTQRHSPAGREQRRIHILPNTQRFDYRKTHTHTHDHMNTHTLICSHLPLCRGLWI